MSTEAKLNFKISYITYLREKIKHEEKKNFLLLESQNKLIKR